MGIVSRYGIVQERALTNFGTLVIPLQTFQNPPKLVNMEPTIVDLVLPQTPDAKHCVRRFLSSTLLG